MEASLIYLSVSYKRATSTKFLELLLYLQFLKKNELKIIFMSKSHILGWHDLFPFTCYKLFEIDVSQSFV